MKKKSAIYAYAKHNFLATNKFRPSTSGDVDEINENLKRKKAHEAERIVKKTFPG